MRRRVLGVGLLIAFVAWWLHDPESATTASDDRPGRGADAAKLRDAVVKLRGAKLPANAFEIRPAGMVTITGTVIDRDTQAGVGNVEVVLKSADGSEEGVLADAGGVYRIDVAPGSYRAFVRDESVLSFGPPKFMRVPTQPEPEDVGVPDETAMPLVVANRDLEHVDLRVVRGGVVRGRVLDRNGRPIARAIVRAKGNQARPVLGTDVVETDKTGTYELVLPSGYWTFEAGHPYYAGIDGTPHIHLGPGDRAENHDLTLVAGCVISGRVIGADGKPADEGALEQGPEQFGLVGRIGAGGTFRFATRLEQDITLRAWPWKSPASNAQTFACREGSRFDNVVLRVPGRGPDIEGTFADASGEPVALAFIDLKPLDPGGLAQQERSDLDGRFAVFQQPAGRYQVTAYVPGRGVLSTVITAPAKDVRLTLGGVGRITGTVKGITNGSFDLRFTSCSTAGVGDEHRAVPITEDSRIVGVRDGKFTLEGVPACKLTVIPTHGGRAWGATVVDIKPNGSTSLALELVDEPPQQPSPGHIQYEDVFEGETN